MLSRPRAAHLVAALAVALSMAVFPAARAAACSCATIGTPAESARAAIASGQLVFIGSAMDASPAGVDPNFGGTRIRYAFAVEAASQPVGATVEVSAIGGDGGASCGTEFAIGQRWVIAATAEADGYTTNLCNANLVLDGLAPDDLAAVRDLLPERPRADDAESDGAIDVPVEILVVAAGVALVGLASALAFRRRVS